MGEKLSVILADRHQNVLEGIRGLLETMFDHVVMVADENSLLETTERLRPDLVVVDLSFPITRESDLVLWLRKCEPGLRFIVLSVHDDQTVAAQCLARGASGFVLKRSAVNDLMPAVDAVLRGDTYVSPSLQTRR